MENKKFNRLLDLWKGVRTKNDLNTQIPETFEAFDPQAAIQMMKQRANEAKKCILILEEDAEAENGKEEEAKQIKPTKKRKKIETRSLPQNTKQLSKK